MEIIVGPYGMQSPWPHRRAQTQLYAQAIEHAVRAEELGFDGVALTEHSFWYDGYCPSLLPVAAAIAQHTSRIKIVLGAFLLPQHDPLKVAEECAVVDRLSHGRLVLGFGAGYRPEEFLGHGVPMGRWGARFIEAAEVVELALTQERFSYKGEFYSYDDVAIGTRPVQDPPEMWVCAGYKGWASKASGRRGWSFCTTGSFDGDPASIFDDYEAGADERGVDLSRLRRGLFRDIMIMPTQLEAEAVLEDDYWPAMSDQFIGFGFLDGFAGRKLTDVPPEMAKHLKANAKFLCGDPSLVRERLLPLTDMKLDLLIARLGWANHRHDRILRAMETFASEVLPLLRNPAVAGSAA